MATTPTPVTRKDGVQTTVHKNVDKDAAKNVSRISVLSTPIDEINPETYNRDLAVEYMEIDGDLFDKVFTPQAILDNANRIYDFIGENGGSQDSIVREQLFTLASEKLGVDYDVLYNKWMGYDTPAVAAPAATVTPAPANDYTAHIYTRDNCIEAASVSPEVFDTVFTPEAILENAGRIYEFIGENGGEADSFTREAMFSYASNAKGLPYDTFYEKWMAG